MVVKGQYVKLTLDASFNQGHRDRFVYIGKDIVGEGLLFVSLGDYLDFKIIPTSVILNAEVFVNDAYDKRVNDSGIIDEGSEEKFKHWLTCLAEKESCVYHNLYYSEAKLAFKLFSLEEFKLYFCNNSSKSKMLAYILSNGLSSDNLDKFFGHHESIARCLRELKPKNEQELADFITFTNKALKKDKREKGLSSQDTSYFYRLANAIAKGADYNDYPRTKVKPALMKEMWESTYSYEDQVPAYASLLHSDLSIEDIYTLVRNVNNPLCKLPTEQLKSLLDSYTTVDDAIKLIRSIDKYNSLQYKVTYQGEMTLAAVTKAIEDELESRRPKVDLTKKVDADSLFM